MSRGVTRRHLLATSAAALVARELVAQTPASRPARHPAARPATVPKGLSVYPYSTSIWVRCNGAMLTCYRASADHKYPYFYPLIGPASGRPMTDEAGDPYPHHRSLLLACDRVSGGNYWQEGLEKGQILSRGAKVESSTPERVVISDTCDWKQPGAESILLDQRRYTIAAGADLQRTIDLEIEWTARRDVTIEKTNHSLCSIRAARDMTPAGNPDAVLANAEGLRGEEATFGQKSPWCGFQANRAGITESIVLMDHPKNPWSPCPWFTRDYGFISPTPFYWIEEPWTLPEGKALRMRYRVLLLGGKLDSREVRVAYEAFAG